jgi:hypothetical protein
MLSHPATRTEGQSPDDYSLRYNKCMAMSRLLSVRCAAALMSRILWPLLLIIACCAVVPAQEKSIDELRRKEQRDKYIQTVSVLDAIRFVPHAAPTPLLFQFARFERYFNEASMLRYARAASQPKEVKWYDTGHELNDIQALRDRADWLQKQIGIKAVKL